MVEPDERVEQVYLVSPDGVVQPTPTVVSPPSAVDWDRLEVLERNDDEGRLEIVGDDAFYEIHAFDHLQITVNPLEKTTRIWILQQNTRTTQHITNKTVT